MKTKSSSGRAVPKLFGFLDIIAYAILAIILVVLFIFLVVLPNGARSNGFKIELNGRQIATYDYSSQTLQIEKGFESNFEVDGLLITVYSDTGREHFNKISIDIQNRSVKVVEANCSNSKDCVYTPALTATEGAIICAPHGIKIVSLSSTGMTPPQTGGAR